MEKTPTEIVSEMGSRLLQSSRPNKGSLVKSLREAATTLSQIEQPLVTETVSKKKALKLLEAELRPLKKSIIKHDLLKNRDNDDIFNLFLAEFSELSDTVSPYFSRRAKILETVSRCKCSLLMLDVDCHDLIHEMFNTFFSVVRGKFVTCRCYLENLVKEGKDATPAANNLANSIQSNLKDSYHEIIFMISLNAPQILLAIIPNLTQELLTDQVDVRIKALNLAGRIFAQPNHCSGEIYRDLFVEFLRRFSDKSAEVRMAALKCGKQCYLANPSGNKASGVLKRLLDFDDRVRTQALVVACDIMKSNMTYAPLI
ncbi:hypothetical protein HID58_008034 [Brassica napus]|uniref:Uncharacterized protein n=1 Tax=Brassica napus TaxID=3708 RepID=A0ABQ7XKB3_BRANA|nr:hypothetical protein HID58_008034 [Brassica napus]